MMHAAAKPLPIVCLAVTLGGSAFAGTALAASSAEDAAAVQRALTGKELSDTELVPSGFVKVAEAKGDLDADGRDDVALLVHRKVHKGHGDQEGMPQLVLVFLRQPSGKCAIWKVGSHHFIDSDPDFMADNGVGTFEIKKGVLKVGTSTAMSSGGWEAGGCTEKWRKGPTGFQLVGLTVDDFSRACACGSTTDTDLLTGVSIYRSDRGEDGEQLKRERVTKTKGKPEIILWEDFDYDKACSSG